MQRRSKPPRTSSPSLPTTSDRPPEQTEFELTLLGRGRGESCVVHLGSHRWMIVDCYLEPRAEMRRVSGRLRPSTTRIPAAASYLDQLYDGSGIEPDVQLIVITHFHLDHYEGVRELHDKYGNAKLAVTDAVKFETFRVIFGEQSTGPLREVGVALKNARRRRFGPSEAVSGLKKVSVGKGLVPQSWDGVNVLALAPSEEAGIQAATELATLLERGADAADVERRLEDDNKTSIALHVTACGSTAILCGDVVNTPGRYGWAAIVENDEHDHLTKAEIVKVAHHGSDTADYQPMWDQFVQPSSPMLVAPYWTSTRPRQTDQARLSARGALSQTGPSAPRVTNEWAPITRQPARTGVIQARRLPGQPWSIGYAAPAHAVQPVR
jgi:Metallo-beta-lactamase superfamily